MPVGGGGARTTHRQQAPPDWIPPRSLARLQDTGLAAVPVGGGGAWPGSETTHRVTRQRPRTTGLERTGGTCRGAGGRRRGLAGLRGAAPNEVRSPSLAGGPPPTGTHSGQAHQGRPRGGRGSGGATSTAGNQAGPQAPAKKLELLVVLRVLVGLAAVGAPERADRRHLFRRQREGEDVEVLALTLRVTGLGQGQGAELVVPAQNEA